MAKRTYKSFFSVIHAVPHQSEFWFSPRGYDAWSCPAYLGILYTAFWRPELPAIAARWSLGGMLLTAEALAGPELAVGLQFEEIIALKGRGFKRNSPMLEPTQLFAMRPLQENWSFLRKICFNEKCTTFPGTYRPRRCSRCRRACYCSQACQKKYIYGLY